MGKKIAIIGAGISSLSCACTLANKDHQIEIFAKAFSPEITSNKAAAFWFPYHIRNDKRGIEWGNTSYTFYEKISADKSSGISMKKLIKVLRKNVVEEESEWIDFMPEDSYKIMDESLLNKNYAKGYEVIVPLIETQIFLPFLQNYLLEKNIRFARREIKSFDELSNDYDIVINCSALGARELCNDSNIIAVRGQVALLSPIHDFPIFLDNEMPLYIVPRKDAVIIGGTYEKGIEDETTENKTIEKLLENAYDVFPSLRNQKVIGSWAGLRPYRNEIRVEIEPETNVIHNYGHGGSGFTLAFGCAKTVSDLVDTI
jgi:D-amino-acid oxidase